MTADVATLRTAHYASRLIYWHRHSYGGYGYGHHGFGLTSGWLTHTILSSVIHGIIYSVIFRVMRHIGLGPSLLLGVLVIGVIWLAVRRREARY